MKKLFVHVGYHKTGTTWLQNNIFDEHPDINFLGKGKLCRTAPGLLSIIRNLQDADSLFDAEKNRQTLRSALEKQCCLPNHKIIGVSAEGLSGGYDWFGCNSGTIAQRIKDVFCDYDVKIIIGIREQTDMISSLYSQYLKRGGTNTLKRLLESPFSEGRIMKKKCEYVGLINNYYALFGEDRVFVYLYEEFRADKQVVINRITDYLSIDRYVVSAKASNKNPNPRPSRLSLVVLRILNHFFYSRHNNNIFILLPLTLIIGFFVSCLLRLKITRKFYPKARLIDQFQNYYEREQFLSERIRSFVKLVLFRVDAYSFGLCKRFRYTLSADLRLKLQEIYGQTNNELAEAIHKDVKKYGYSVAESA